MLLPPPARPRISTRSPGATSKRGSASRTRPCRVSTARSSSVSRPSGCGARSNRSEPASKLSRSSSARRKSITRANVARQSAIGPVLSTNQRSAFCTWLKAPTTIISVPNDRLPLK